jgi:RNA polymerase sigma factor (sigma-70 family)
MGAPAPAARERFTALFLAHYGEVDRFARRRAEPALAEEIVSETFTICWAKLHSVPDPALPWLYAVARRCLANRRRAAARRDRTVSDLRSQAGTVRDPAERLAERDAILRAFVSLAETDRDALRLVAWEGLSLADAARVAGTSRPAFAMRLHRARRRLAASLEDEPDITPDPALLEAS